MMQDWQTAVKQAMRQAAEKEARRKFDSHKPPFLYRWEHVTAVVTNALKLAELTGADREVVEAAAWLHDVRKDTGDDHPVEGAIFARDLLPQTDFPPEKIEHVARTIEDHMGLWRDEPLTNLESQVLWDADKLAKLGLTAVFHWSPDWVARGKAKTVEKLLSRLADNDWQAKAVASMHTAPAKKAAQQRLTAYQNLLSMLQAELSGEDITPAGDDSLPVAPS